MSDNCQVCKELVVMLTPSVIQHVIFLYGVQGIFCKVYSLCNKTRRELILRFTPYDIQHVSLC